MLEIIIKYWVEFLLGAIAGGLTLLCKKFWKLYKDEKNHQKTKEQKEFYTGLQQLIIKGDKALQDQVDVIKGGVLSIQRKNFKETCEAALREGHEISLEEFESLQEERKIYHSLGGNHDGDILFDMVKEKATHNLVDK